MRRTLAVAVAAAAVLAACTCPTDAGPVGDTTAADATTTKTAPDATTTTTTTPRPSTTATSQAPTQPSDPPYAVPVVEAATAGWSPTHAAYPATDLFVPSDCGGGVVSSVDGTVIHVRRENQWDEAVDNPATRGGRSVAILGDDGVRYYLAHFDTIESTVEVGVRVTAGQALGTVGDTGRTSACHVHFGISPPCPVSEYIVRRGVIWPYPYLDAWRRGEPLSPADEVKRWLAEHPDVRDEASADPFAADS